MPQEEEGKQHKPIVSLPGSQLGDTSFEVAEEDINKYSQTVNISPAPPVQPSINWNIIIRSCPIFEK
jgi:hypothetical protein